MANTKQAACHVVMSTVVLSRTVARNALWEISVSHAYFRQLLFANTVGTSAVRIFPGVLYVCTWPAIPVRCFDNRQSLGECRTTCRNRKAGRCFQNSVWHHLAFAILQPEYQTKALAPFTRHISAGKIIKCVLSSKIHLSNVYNTIMCL